MKTLPHLVALKITRWLQTLSRCRPGSERAKYYAGLIREEWERNG